MRHYEYEWVASECRTQAFNSEIESLTIIEYLNELEQSRFGGIRVEKSLFGSREKPEPD